MSLAKVIEVTASSPTTFEDAVRSGIAKAATTIHGIQGAWIKNSTVVVEDGLITEFRVNMKVSFLLEDAPD